MDDDFSRNKVAYKLKGGPTILAWISLIFGIFWYTFPKYETWPQFLISAALSIMWIIQIIAWTNLSILGPKIGYPLLNFMLVAMDGVWQFFGVSNFAKQIF